MYLRENHYTKLLQANEPTEINGEEKTCLYCRYVLRTTIKRTIMEALAGKSSPNEECPPARSEILLSRSGSKPKR